MKAKDISGQAPGGRRTKLAEALPLDTPFVVQIFPVYACNFTCHYCIFSIDKKKHGFISDEVVMDLSLYKKCVDDMTAFPHKIKVLRFVGIGEPLLHKHIAEMIQYAASKNIAERIELLTNGLLLTPPMSDKLLAAGLSRLVVSLQGITAEKYKEICGVTIDMSQFIDNLRYFFHHKGQAQMYIKIIDCALKDKEEERQFFQLFGDICDTLAVEHAVPIHSGVDYKTILGKEKMPVTQFGLPVSEVKICPQPFFTMQINPDGKVVPCYSFEYPQIMGNCHDQSVCEIWNGKPYRQFRCLMLDGIQNVGVVCAHCNIIKYRLFPEDVLNEDAERLKKLYGTDE